MTSDRCMRRGCAHRSIDKLSGVFCREVLRQITPFKRLNTKPIQLVVSIGTEAEPPTAVSKSDSDSSIFRRVITTASQKARRALSLWFGTTTGGGSWTRRVVTLEESVYHQLTNRPHMVREVLRSVDTSRPRSMFDLVLIAGAWRCIILHNGYTCFPSFIKPRLRFPIWSWICLQFVA
jgi:hypothetical protein